MKNSKKIVFNGVMLTLLINGAAMAGDVKMFSGQPPSAHEMGNILFSKQPAAERPMMKMRSISFSKPVVEPSAVPTAPAQIAESADTIGLPIKFAYNSDEILSESKPFLDEVGKMLNLPDFASERLVVEGHTDAGGSESYNHNLSQRRAASVKDYLVSNYQISYARLSVIGKGESSPLQGKNPFDAENRRVQFYKAP